MYYIIIIIDSAAHILYDLYMYMCVCVSIIMYMYIPVVQEEVVHAL